MEIESIFQYLTKNVHLCGNELTMSCPFPGHIDNDPSFSINIHTQAWYCHGCHVGGYSVYSLLARLGYKGYKRLCLMAGLTEELEEIQEESVEEPRSTTYDQDLLLAEQMYSGNEDWSRDCDEQRYLISRNFYPETLCHFHVRILRGVPRHTILIPVSFNGQVYGWQRTSAWHRDSPKYLTMTGTKRSENFYGEIRPGELLVLCEGPTDIWMAWQRGCRSMVATLGSYPSYKQLELLSEVAGIICAYHDDQAGDDGYRTLQKYCSGERKFLTRLKLTTDIAESTIADYHTAMQLAWLEYERWKCYT